MRRLLSLLVKEPPLVRHKYGSAALLIVATILVTANSEDAISAPPRPTAAAMSTELQALLEGRLNDAIPALERAVASQPTPETQLLLCRALFSERNFDDAQPLCQVAADAPGASASAYLWLGRVEGERARHANPLSAFSLARKTKAAFAHAVDLDPSNNDSVDDLGEYLVQAPGVVGGGLDQAHALAQRVLATAPAAAHRTLALAAVKEEDPARAEREYRAATATARPAEVPGTWVDLARFLEHQGNAAGANAAVRSALAADRPPTAATVDAARTLEDLHGSPEEVIALLRAYLASPARSDAAPAWRVHLHLARLLESRGDTTGAAHERALAKSLAPGVDPALTEAAPARQVP